jgi:hypothetical protein
VTETPASLSFAPHARVAERRRHTDPLFVDGELVDWRRLKIVKDLPRVVIIQFVYERRRRRRARQFPARRARE